MGIVFTSSYTYKHTLALTQTKHTLVHRHKPFEFGFFTFLNVKHDSAENECSHYPSQE